jgi:predicted O-methyltransferase YrrM
MAGQLAGDTGTVSPFGPGHGLVIAVTRFMASSRLFRPRAGHYYSPIPSKSRLLREQERIFSQCSDGLIKGIELDPEAQLRLVDSLSQYYDEQPFQASAVKGRRYYFDNVFYRWADAIMLYSLMRHLSPKRIIEIGSGYSSFVMLDTNELFFDKRIELTFIEPDSKRLRSRLKPGDLNHISILERPVQEIEPDVFERLEANDILFVDSTHVSKAGSDVNHILFNILPALHRGVFVHFHDIWYPFEYPLEWLRYGIYWNEAYMLRSFLSFNSRFRIRLWNNYLLRFHSDFLKQRMPLCAVPVDFGLDGSLWIESV